MHQNSIRSKVKLTLAARERWITAREKKGFRDENRMLILPIISMKRSEIEPSLDSSYLRVETSKLQFAKKISKKTNDLMNLHAQRSPALRTPPKPVVYEVYSIPFPDRSVVTYEIQVQAQYITQMNSILEKIFHELDIGKSFVAPLDNFHRHPPIGEDFERRKKMDDRYVVGFFDSGMSDRGNFEEFTDQERVVQWSTTIRVPAVLQLDPDSEKPSVQVERTAFRLSFSDESVTFVDDADELDKIFGPR